MNKTEKGLFMIGISLFVFLFTTSCDLSYDGLLQEYNECFNPALGTKVPADVGASGFDQYQMLSDDMYLIKDDCSVFFNAPNGGSFYHWTLKDTSLTNDNIVSYQETQSFFYESTKVRKIGVQYELTLDVGYSSDKNYTYTDKAIIIFYKSK